MTLHLFSLLFVLLAVAFAPAPFPRTPRPERNSGPLEGWWANEHTRIEIKGDRLTYDNGKILIPNELRLHANTRPRGYDLRGVSECRPGPWVYSGIYKVEGDTLTLRYRWAISPRPTTFDGDDTGMITEVYRRVKR